MAQALLKAGIVTKDQVRRVLKEKEEPKKVVTKVRKESKEDECSSSQKTQ